MLVALRLSNCAMFPVINVRDRSKLVNDENARNDCMSPVVAVPARSRLTKFVHVNSDSIDPTTPAAESNVKNCSESSALNSLRFHVKSVLHGVEAIHGEFAGILYKYESPHCQHLFSGPSPTPEPKAMALEGSTPAAGQLDKSLPRKQCT